MSSFRFALTVRVFALLLAAPVLTSLCGSADDSPRSAFPFAFRAAQAQAAGFSAAKPLDDFSVLVFRAEQRAAALSALEFTRALDAVTAMHGPQDLRAYTARQAADTLLRGGWIDPMLPFEFDATPLSLGRDQRFHPALKTPTPQSGGETDIAALLKQSAPVQISPALQQQALADKRFFVRWYALACLAEYPGRGEQAPLVLAALTREQMPALTHAYAEALKPLSVYAHLPEAKDLPGLAETLARLNADPVNLDARCLGLLLATATGKSFPGADASLVLAQLARDYPVQSLELVVRSLPLSVLETLADGLRLAWAQPQDRLAALLARFPTHGPSLEALTHALLNRNHPDYAPSHHALIKTWEQLTGIPFKGDDEPYLQWYHAHKPMPGLYDNGG